MTSPPNGRRSYAGARALAVMAAVLILGPLFPRDLYDSPLSIVWGLVLGMTAGQIGKAIAKINEGER